MIAACAGVLLTVSGASAHANYKSSTPAKGEVLSASPSQVSVTFTQDVQKITGTFGIEVANADGASVTSGEVALDDDDRSTMTVPLQPALPDGRYAVRWKNVSDADGDDANGAFSFYVGVQPSVENLAADDALAEIGAGDETPEPTFGASTPSDGATAPTASATAVTPSSDDDGGGSGTVIIIVVIVVAGIALGFAGVRLLTRRRS